jgi:hypothetical protein
VPAEAGQDLAEMSGAAVDVEHAAKAHAADDQTPRPRAKDRHARSGARAERIAAEVIVRKAEMGDELGPVAGEHVGRVGGGIVRSAALAVAAKVHHQHAKAARRELCGVAELQPVRPGVGEEAVEEEDRPPLPHFVKSELDAVRSGEAVSGDGGRSVVGHGASPRT